MQNNASSSSARISLCITYGNSFLQLSSCSSLGTLSVCHLPTFPAITCQAICIIIVHFLSAQILVAVSCHNFSFQFPISLSTYTNSSFFLSCVVQLSEDVSGRPELANRQYVVWVRSSISSDRLLLSSLCSSEQCPFFFQFSLLTKHCLLSAMIGDVCFIWWIWCS